MREKSSQSMNTTLRKTFIRGGETKVMKKTLSSILVFALVLTMLVPAFAFAADARPSAEVMAKELSHIFQGDHKGDLNLDGNVDRAALSKVISILMNLEVVPPAADAEPAFTDVTTGGPKWAYFDGYIDAVVKAEYMEGIGNGKFNPGGDVSYAQIATVLARLLGIADTGTGPDWYAKNLAAVQELGFLTDIDAKNANDAAPRRILVEAAWIANAKLNPPVSTDLEVTAVAAIANNKVEVKVKEEVNAAANSFSVVKKGTTDAVEVKGVVKESAKVFIVETEALTAGTAYTLNGKDFTGIAKDTTAPTVSNFEGVDTNTFEISFSDKMDFASATNVDNYKFSGNVKVVKAELNGTRTAVTLTTDVAKRNVVYTVTVEGVKNSDGVSIVKTTRTAVAKEDRVAPRVTTLQLQNNEMVIVKFIDDSGMNKEALENVGNYSINDLEITSATAIYNSTLEVYDEVVLKTATQTPNKSYTLTMNNLTDDAVLKNPLGKQTRNFRGASADVTGPVVNSTKKIESYNNNTVYVYFSDHNALDRASAEDVSNYIIKDRQGNILNVLDAKLASDTYKPGYTDNGRRVTLTTDPQDIDKKEVYKVEVRGVADEFGNVLKPISGNLYATYNFPASPVDTVPPHVTKVEFVNSTSVKLTFNEPVVGDSAVNPTNYNLGTSLGHAIKATRSADQTVITLTTHPMKDNARYTVTFKDIVDRAGNVADGETAVFVATSSTLDTEAPSIDYIYAVNKNEIHIKLNERVQGQPGTIVVESVDTNGNFDGKSTVTFAYEGRVDGGTTVIYASTTDLDKDRNYKIKTSTGGQFTDLSLNKTPNFEYDTTTNPVTEKPEVASRFAFYGLDANAYTPEVSYVEQTSSTTIKIYFTDYVTTKRPPALFGTPGMDRSTGDDNFANVWTLTLAGNATFKAGSKYTIETGDFSGVVAQTNVPKYVFDSYYEDTVAPVLLDAVAIHKNAVKLTYDEAIKSSGTYRIYYYDANNRKVDIYNGPASSFNTARTELTVTFVKPLESRLTYFVEPVTGSVDYANNKELTSGVVLSFLGTDKETAGYISGVKIINANLIEVETQGIVNPKVKSVSVSSSVYGKHEILDSHVTDLKVDLLLPVLQGERYTVELVDGSQYTFNGNTPDYGIRLADKNGVTGEATLDWAAMDTDVYTVEVLTATGAAAGTLVPGANQWTSYTVQGLTDKTAYYVVLKNKIGTVVYAQIFFYEDK